MKAQQEARARRERLKQIGRRPVPFASLDKIQPTLRMTETDSNNLPVLKRTLGRKRKEKAKKQLQAVKTTVKMRPIKLEGGDFPNAVPPM
jgi:hypothetical protein